MKREHWLGRAVLTGMLLAATSYATTTEIPRVGTLQYTDGKVFLGDRLFEGDARHPALIPGTDQLRTEDGHAEILLTPGVYLRLGEHSAIRLLNNSLTDTRVRFEKGSAIIEADELHKENNIQVETGGATVRLLKTGLYRFDSEPLSVKVLKGEAQVETSGKPVKLGKNHLATLAPAISVKKFSPENDDTNRWSRLRSEYEAEASVSSAQYIYDFGWGWWRPGWFWNPWFGAFTWVPAGGWLVNPYGFGYWSPAVVYTVFPVRYYNSRLIAHFQPALGRVAAIANGSLPRVSAAAGASRSMTAAGRAPRIAAMPRMSGRGRAR